MIAAALAAVCRLISGASVQWHCDPNTDAQRIYFGNHSSHLDFIVIWSALPRRLRRFARPVAGRDYWEQGAVRRYLAGQVFHAVLIERTRPGSNDSLAVARASVERMADEMGDRNSLIVFPEGTRSLNGEVGAFKSGLYHLSPFAAGCRVDPGPSREPESDPSERRNASGPDVESRRVRPAACARTSPKTSTSSLRGRAQR